jgi:adenylate cyclase
LRDSAREPRLIVTVPKRGYQLIAPVAFADVGDSPKRAPGFVSNPPPGLRSRAKHRPWVVAIVAAGIAALAAGAWILVPWPDKAPAPVSSTSTNRPSIVVLPFTNLSADPSREYFSDGITADIITDLSRLRSLRVIARTSAFAYKGQAVDAAEIGRELGVRYVVEGSVQRSKRHLRINVQVTDARTGFYLWGERYEGSVDDVFAVQDKVTRNIADTLSVQLTPDERRNLGRAATRSFAAYDLFLQGQQQFQARTRAGSEHAIEAYRQAIELDPKFARAYGALAVSLTLTYWRGWTDSPNDSRERALALARQGVVLDNRSPQTYWSLGYVHLYRKEYDQATKAAERAVALAPNYADGYGLLAFIDNHTDRYEPAIVLIKRAMALNPHYTFDYPYNLGRAYYGLGRYSDAVGVLKEALEHNPNAALPRLFLAASYRRLGRQEDADWEIQQILMNDPGVTRSQIARTLPFQDQAELGRLLADLQRAGLPE